MPYTSNPYIAKARRYAVQDVRKGRKTQAEAARHYGVTRSTIHKWLKRADLDHRKHIETRSSAPLHSPNKLPQETIEKILELRKRTGRCSIILYITLKNQGIKISLSSIARILRKYGLTKRKKQLKPPYAKIPRPLPTIPGILVEMDTIHYVRSNGTRFYLYTLIDVCSRYCYAEYYTTLSPRNSAEVVKNAQKHFTFKIKTIQTDHGSEFSEGFYFLLRDQGIKHRHTRIRKPNDNAHIERFNRTIQEEGFKSKLPNENTIQKDLKKFIHYYNNERYHLGINCNTPCSFVSKLEN